MATSQFFLHQPLSFGFELDLHTFNLRERAAKRKRIVFQSFALPENGESFMNSEKRGYRPKTGSRVEGQGKSLILPRGIGMSFRSKLAPSSRESRASLSGPRVPVPE